MRRVLWLLLGVLAVAAVQPQPVPAQRVHVGDENVVCPQQFKPISGQTFHDGHAWLVTYSTAGGQWGYAMYSGSPNPAKSTDGEALWWNPSVYIHCYISWYRLPDGRMEADLHLYFLAYYGRVVEEDCYDGGIGGGMHALDYDPYSPHESASINSESSDCEGDSDSDGGGGGGEGCAWVYVEIEVFNGQTWDPFWAGYACEPQ